MDTIVCLLYSKKALVSPRSTRLVIVWHGVIFRQKVTRWYIFPLTGGQGEVSLTNEALDSKAATQFVRDAVKFGEIDLSAHARKKMNARSFDLNDLLLVLSNGKVTAGPDYDERHHNFKYSFTGPTPDDDLATAIVVLLDHRTVYVVTMFGSGEKP